VLFGLCGATTRLIDAVRIRRFAPVYPETGAGRYCMAIGRAPCSSRAASRVTRAAPWCLDLGRAGASIWWEDRCLQARALRIIAGAVLR